MKVLLGVFVGVLVLLLVATLFGGTLGDLGPMMGGFVVNGGVFGMLFTLVFLWVAVVLIGALGVWIFGQVRRCQVMLDRDTGGDDRANQAHQRGRGGPEDDVFRDRQ